MELYAAVTGLNSVVQITNNSAGKYTAWQNTQATQVMSTLF